MDERLGQINDHYYALYGELYESSELLSREQLEVSRTVLLHDYMDEIKLYKLQREIEVAREMYRLKQLKRALVPRMWRFLLIFWHRYNKSADIINRKVDDIVRLEFLREEREISRNKSENDVTLDID